MFCVASRKPFYLALSKRLYVCMFIWGCVFVSFVRGGFVLFAGGAFVLPVRINCVFLGCARAFYWSFCICGCKITTNLPKTYMVAHTINTI